MHSNVDRDSVPRKYIMEDDKVYADDPDPTQPTSTAKPPKGDTVKKDNNTPPSNSVLVSDQLDDRSLDRSRRVRSLSPQDLNQLSPIHLSPPPQKTILSPSPLTTASNERYNAEDGQSPDSCDGGEFELGEILGDTIEPLNRDDEDGLRFSSLLLTNSKGRKENDELLIELQMALDLVLRESTLCFEGNVHLLEKTLNWTMVIDYEVDKFHGKFIEFSFCVCSF